MRADKWLWQARFFKSRARAAALVEAGHLRVNGIHAGKPAQTVRVGDILTFVQERAVLEVGSELFHRRNAPNGVAQFAALDGAPIRVARDPMVAARPLLSPYLGGGFA